MVPFIWETIGTRGFAKGHGVNSTSKFVQSDRSLKRGNVRRRKRRKRERREEGIARDRVKGRRGVKCIEVVTHVLVTGIRGRKGSGIHIAKRLKCRTLRAIAETGVKVVTRAFALFQPVDVSTEDSAVSSRGVEIGELSFEILKILMELRSTRIEVATRLALVDLVFELSLLAGPIFGNLKADVLSSGHG